MADPKYSLVRIDDNIADGAVLTYDAKNDKLVDSGLTAKYGELQAGADSVAVGLQTMSSAGEQVVWENDHTSVVYAPPWHIIDEVNTEGSRDRVYGILQEAVVFSDKSGVVENPINNINVPENGIVFSYTIDFPEARNNVSLAIYYLDPSDPTLTEPPKALWREMRDISAGENVISLTVPNSLYNGDYFFQITPVVSTDAPVKVVGNPQTGEFAYSTKYRTFREIPLATKEYVDTAVAGGVGTDLMTKAVYDTDNDGKVNIAAMADQAVQVVGITSARNNYYYGKDSTGQVGFHALPAGADEAKLQALIEDNSKEIIKSKDAIAKHETSIDAHGVQLANQASQIRGADSTANSALTLAQQNAETIVTNKKNAVTGLTVVGNSTAKTITLQLTSDNGTVDTAQINLTGWFDSGGSTPTPTDHSIYYGFTSRTPLSESDIIRQGTHKTTPTVNGLDVNLTRQTTSPQFIWIWLPDSVGAIKGFEFSGFLSTWGSSAVNVAGADGKLFVSPNQTSATTVAFEVTQ